MAKLVIVVGDYGGGTVEDAIANKIPLDSIRSADSADARVLNEIIRQDPNIHKVVTFPISRQFSPNSAGVITREAVKWAFEVLDKKIAGYENIDEVAVVANVAPGIKSLNGADNAKDGGQANLDREPFVTGIVTKDNKKIVLGSTHAFLEGEGHTLGAVTELESEGYTLSEFKAIGGNFVTTKLTENGQFRSRWALAYMAAQGEKVECVGEDILPTAKEHQTALRADIQQRDEREGVEVFTQMKDFLPIIQGDATQGFVTVISDSAHLNAKLKQYYNQYQGQFISGLSFDGNETARDKKLIASLPDEADRQNYRLTRQAFLAANMALEFDRERGAGTRRIVIDSADAPLTAPDKPVYEATLTNHSKIITTNPTLFALVMPHILDLKKEEKTLNYTDWQQALKEARDFKDYLADKCIENDPYRNVKLATPFGKRQEEISQLLEGEMIPEDKAVELTVVAKTGALTEERVIYYTPHSVGSFGMWGHPKISSGSTRLGNSTEKQDYQAEIFTAGCPTAGNVFTVIPGVTSFSITQAKLIDKSLLETPGEWIKGTDKVEDITEAVSQDAGYGKVHGLHVAAIRARQSDGTAQSYAL